jgi:uncharacterized protein
MTTGTTSTTIHEFEVVSSEGFPIRGKMYLPESMRAPSVLMVHGDLGYMDWGFMPVLATRLANAGVAACCINLSCSGIGEDRENFTEKQLYENGTITQDLSDIMKVLGLLTKGRIPGAQTLRGKVGVFGYGRGAGEAMLASDLELLVASLACWSCVSRFDRFSAEQMSNWRREGFLRITDPRTGTEMRLKNRILEDINNNRDRLDIMIAASRLDIPGLMVHGTTDQVASFSDASSISGALGRSSELLAIKDAGFLFGATHPMPEPIPAQLEEAMEATVAHFVRNLL